MSRRTMKRLFVLLGLVLGLATLSIARPDKQNNDKKANAAAGKHDNDKPGARESHQPVDPSRYVGADTCKTCHEDVAKGYDKGPHWKTTLAKHQGPQWQGCEACHGPGKDHTESAYPAPTTPSFT